MAQYTLWHGIFEWDDEKARVNQEKHGVEFLEATGIFLDPFLVRADDPDHSGKEEREIAIGQSFRGRILFVSFTVRGTPQARRIRIISARKAIADERRKREKQRKQSDESS